MKISAFTFVKNAMKYDYPVVESIRSILPLADEYIVCLGDSEDGTNELVTSIGSGKIKTIHSVWDKTLREGGRVLAVETDKAMDATAGNANWLFYLQADEVVHEKYLPVIKEAMEKYNDDEKVEGLLFRYLHFYGSYKYTGNGPKWYSREIRVIKNNKNIRAYRDAQGFRIHGRKLRVKEIDAYVYHYGWVRNPLRMQEKWKDFNRHWDDEEAHNRWRKEVEAKGSEFDYSEIDSLTSFEESHPLVMQERINKEDWEFNHDIKKKRFKNFRHRLIYIIQQRFGWRPFEYSNYKMI
jgi:hypothetical protein